MEWPGSADELIREQSRLAEARPAPWRPSRRPYAVGGCFVCFPRGPTGPGGAGDPAWSGAARIASDGRVETAGAVGRAGAPYRAGLLALREGPLLEAAVRRLSARPEVLLVNATGRDHPRRAGLALHLGALLELPSVGVTHRVLTADGEPPAKVRGERSPLELAGELVGFLLCTRDGTRPLAVHTAWRTDPETAAEVVLAASSRAARTPEPIRRARRVAREARAEAAGARIDHEDS